MTSKYALVIANTEYQDSAFARLTAPGWDAEEFAQTLRDLARFEGVQILLNEGEGKTRRSIARFFADRKRDDLLLLYFSGHGVRNEQGQLFLAANDTEMGILEASGIPSEFVTDAMNNSRSQRQVLILDCCNSGAFAQGTKSASGLGKSMGIATAFEGSGFGRVVLTATDAAQYAWEGEKVTGDMQESLFTHFLIEGLRGDADQNDDGCIDVDELFDYAYDKVVRTTPKQTPGKWSYKQQGDIILRENLTPGEVKAVPLPPDVLELLSHPNSSVRRAGIRDLIILMQGKHPGLARAAEEKLREIAETDDSLTIRRTARDELMVRGAALDKDTTGKFSKEYLAARAAQEASPKASVNQKQAGKQPTQMDETIPPSESTPAAKSSPSQFSIPIIGWVGGGLLILLILFAGGSFVYPLLFPASTPTNTLQPTAIPTLTSRPVATRTLVSTKTSSPSLAVTLTKMRPSLIPPTKTHGVPSQTSTATPGYGSTKTADKDGMILLHIPAGEFTMGSDKGDQNELPQHTVYLDAFWIDKTEITNHKYSLCVVNGGCERPTNDELPYRKGIVYYGNPIYDNYPVVYVPWQYAKKYCEWAGRRLPTEAEWEKAARGTDLRSYPWGSDRPNTELLNYYYHEGGVVEVGIHPTGASPYGAFDMAGNVWEWTADYYKDNYYANSPSINPLGPEKDTYKETYRVLRGGAWYNDEDEVLVYHREGENPVRARNYQNIGFRCAMSATP